MINRWAACAFIGRIFTVSMPLVGNSQYSKAGCVLAHVPDDEQFSEDRDSCHDFLRPGPEYCAHCFPRIDLGHRLVVVLDQFQ